jgi:hypothetical protein
VSDAAKVDASGADVAQRHGDIGWHMLGPRHVAPNVHGSLLS